MTEQVRDHQSDMDGEIELAWRMARYEDAAMTALSAARANPDINRSERARQCRTVSMQLALRMLREEGLLPAYEALEYAFGVLQLPGSTEQHFEYMVGRRTEEATRDFAAGRGDRSDDPQFMLEDRGMLLAAGIISPKELLLQLGITPSEQAPA